MNATQFAYSYGTARFLVVSLALMASPASILRHIALLFVIVDTAIAFWIVARSSEPPAPLPLPLPPQPERPLTDATGVRMVHCPRCESSNTVFDCWKCGAPMTVEK